MIPVNELRIDNYILFKQFGKGKGKIGQMKSGDFGRVKCDDNENSEYHPIPLTPEWLERCGIIENESSLPGDLRFTGEGNFTIEAVEEGKLKYYLPFNRKIEVKYLHQLQNIYFALTGIELEVKLP